MAYDEKAYTNIATSIDVHNTSKETEPESPAALKALATASADYAEAAARYIEVRSVLAAMAARYQECLDRCAKAREREGV